MRRAAATIAATLAWTACSLAGPAAPVTIEPARPFSLRLGESAQSRDGLLRVGFEAVTADSRCPKGVQCVWAGEAVVRVWVEQGTGPREMQEMRASPAAALESKSPEPALRLLQLEPHPVAGRPIAKADYLATFRFERGTASAPDR